MKSTLSKLLDASIAFLLAFAGSGLIASNLVHAAEKAIFFHNDISGTPLAASDESGNIIWKETYKPYGERINHAAGSTNGKGKNELYFHGKQQETLKGGVTIQYSGARYYSPELGPRFLGVDPMGFTPSNLHSFNRFAHASNNPYKFTDPDGHQSIPMSNDPRLFAEQAWARFTVNVTAAADAAAGAITGLVPGSAAYGCMSGGCGAIGWGLASLDVAGPAGKAVGKVGGAIKGAHEATGVMGRSGNELKNALVQKTRNEAAEISGRSYSAHALDQMQNRGIVPSVVENTINTGNKFSTRTGTTGYFDSANNIRVITNSESGKVVTVIPGAP